ncbi:MAG: TonB-dependent receptor, partial [Bacteroidetes bacterium]|nr:TonB-dependent receptor [Bacteroidota bacterium]
MLKFKTIFLIILALLLSIENGHAQDITQTVRGTILDSETKIPQVAATVAIYDGPALVSASTTDADGMFRFDNIPVGRYAVVCSFIGYRQVNIPDVIVGAGKEVVLPVEMEESAVEIDEITIRANGRNGETLNKMTFVSARSFSVEESNRYAGSRGDPARMASNYAGVQGNDDQSNDLVIRGNSPLGVLWRCEGVNIPNPNHFGVSGGTGGPVTVLNNKVLAGSDFMTAAFPAEFGNSNAGVFDLRMRNGNNEKHEFSGQLGFLGTELTAEGPISKKGRSSYLAAYRYSTLYILQTLGIQIGTDAIPQYQDLSFKLNFPVGKSGKLSIFGLGGTSYVEILASEQEKPDENKVFGDEAMDEHFQTSMGVVGMSYSRPFGTSSFMKLTLAASREHQTNRLDKVFRHLENGMYVIDTIHYSYNAYHSNVNKYSAKLSWNKKISRQLSFRAGITFDTYEFDMLDSIFNETSQAHVTRLDHTGKAFLTQPYLQWKYKPSDKLTFNAGLHGQFLHLEENRSSSLEPRMGINYRVNEKHSLSYGIGMHSQMLPTYIYFTRMENAHGEAVEPNRNLDYINSFHNVLAWDYYMNPEWRFKVETYYQHLYQVPVEYLPSSYSVLDEGHDMNRFFPDSLVNMGTGRNIGLELTMEKFFSKSYFLMLTASLFDARRTGSNKIDYHTIFNGGYSVNLLGSKEFSWGMNRDQSFTIGGKITFAGGKRYTPIDEDASEIAGEAVYQDQQRN